MAMTTARVMSVGFLLSSIMNSGKAKAIVKIAPRMKSVRLPILSDSQPKNGSVASSHKAATITASSICCFGRPSLVVAYTTQNTRQHVDPRHFGEFQSDSDEESLEVLDDSLPDRIFRQRVIRFHFLETGVSGTFDLMKVPSASRTILTRNGTRHPHAAKSASDSFVASANTTEASTMPMGKPIWTKLL